MEMSTIAAIVLLLVNSAALIRKRQMDEKKEN